MLQKDFKPKTSDQFALDYLSEREKWLFENKAALKKVKKGLQDTAEGKVAKKGSFAKFAD